MRCHLPLDDPLRENAEQLVENCFATHDFTV
jgi:hypothetical protein